VRRETPPGRYRAGAPGTDDDGLFDDINGNGRIDLADAVRLSDRL
jgi:hypothetical protein